MAQKIDIAGIVMWNLGANADLKKLPRTRLSYDGQAADAPWRAQAMRQIEQHRKADILLSVTDSTGMPFEVNLKRHAFSFATFIEDSSPRPRDRSSG